MLHQPCITRVRGVVVTETEKWPDIAKRCWQRWFQVCIVDMEKKSSVGHGVIIPSRHRKHGRRIYWQDDQHHHEPRRHHHDWQLSPTIGCIGSRETNSSMPRGDTGPAPTRWGRDQRYLLHYVVFYFFAKIIHHMSLLSLCGWTSRTPKRPTSTKIHDIFTS